ncbi:MAG: DUF1805 domain-containing protein [Firmicutes bacterium]|nr:DUF1805 domain-containing protein [Bacillota bacterium]
MVAMRPVQVADKQPIAVEIELPKTHLQILVGKRGYLMCGALDVRLLDERLSDRQIVAARAVGVKSIDDLLDAPLQDVTKAAETLGIHRGMRGREAILRLMD